MHLNLLQQVGCTDTDTTERRKYGSKVVVNVVFVVIIVVVVVGASNHFLDSRVSNKNLLREEKKVFTRH